MTYIFDENTSAHLVQMLKHLNADVCHIFDEYPQGILDTDFLPDIGRKELILVTVDHKMRSYTGKHGHGIILRENKVKALFLPRSYHTGFMGASGQYPSVAWAQCAWVLQYWPKIDSQVSRMTNLTLARITDKGKVEPIR